MERGARLRTEAVTRRTLLKTAASAAVAAAVNGLTPARGWAAPRTGAAEPTEGSGRVVGLTIRRQVISIVGRKASAMVINGTLPGPLLRFREGETVTIRVTNELDESASIHWHGLLVPYDMDGVPGVSFPGIEPGATFTYRYTVRQSGTYWYHSHSGNQEQSGVYGPLVIDPVERDPVAFDREHVLVLSDWTFEDPKRVLAKLKKQAAYYNFQQRTVFDFFRDVSREGLGATVAERAMWGRMRMDPTDIADVTGYAYTYLVNGRGSAVNWTALFRAGERVRLRFINAAAMTHFDVRIPGLEMTLVQADGQNVHPVPIEEFRIAPAETYDLIVRPPREEAYRIFAEAMDRSGYAAALLAPGEGMGAPIPPRRPRPLRTMADLGMAAESMEGGP